MHSAQFTDLTIVHRGASAITAKAKRYGRWWTLKALKEDLRDDAQHATQLREEFDFFISLQHPHIVSAVGMEEVKGLGFCIVMEWIDGQTLDDWLQEKHMRQERLQMMLQILSALEYACKEKGRQIDLRPSDVMIARSGVGVKLIGFGVQEKEFDGLACILQAMELGRMYIPVIRRCGAKSSRRHVRVEEVKHAFERVPRLCRLAAASFFTALFVAFTLLSWSSIAADRHTIDTLNARLDSSRNALSEIVENKQALNAFVEEAKRYMEVRARYDLDTLNTYAACAAARKGLLNELGKALTEYYALHDNPVSYGHIYARLNLLDYRREIIRPIAEKQERLRIEEGRDEFGRKKGDKTPLPPLPSWLKEFE